MRILKDITFNETEIAIFINIRNLPKKATTLITFTEITEIIENIPNISDIDIADINDINIIFENIENTFFENIIVEPAPVRRSTRHRKAIFKVIEINVVIINIVGIAEASIIFTNEKESEEEDYLSKAMIAKIIIVNEDKLTYEEVIADSEKFQ
jgi:hypothetical protein